MPIGIDNNNSTKKVSWIKRIFLGILVIVVLLVAIGYFGVKGLGHTMQLESLYINLHNTVWVMNNKSIVEKEEAIDKLKKFDQYIPNKKFLSLRGKAIILARKKLELNKKWKNNKSNEMYKEIKDEADILNKEYEEWFNDFQELQKNIYK
jgi:hypothetical protein